MDQIGQEIRHAARRLLHSPAFTVAAVLTLALAIGANAAMFALVERVVLNPLPYPESDRLIELDHGALRLNAPSGLGLTSGMYFHYADRSRTLEHLAVHRTDDLTLTGTGEAERIRVARVTPSLAAVLRVPPSLGRWFSEQEGAPGAPHVAILSHGLWMRRYGGDTSVLGRSVTLGGDAMQIVGVMPASFTFPNPRVELWTAERLTPAMGFGLWNYTGVARLRDGATVEDARAELNALIEDLAKAYPNDPLAAGNVEAKLIFVGRSLKEAMVGHVERGLWILLASVGLVLLVACANVANLFLVRSDARQREVAVRRALGASRLSIARYFLTESMLLSMAGGVVGLALAWGAVRLVVGFAPPNLPRLEEIRLDGVVIAFTFVLSALAALAFGASALPRFGVSAARFRSARSDIAAPLYESGRGNTASRSRQRARQVLMGAQVAIALVLIVSSGLMMRSFQELRAMDPGFDPESALTFSLGLPDREYPTRESAVAAHHAIIDRLSTLPGVRAASASTCLPLTGGCSGNTLRVEGRTYEAGTIPPIALFRAVAGGYFETAGIRLLRGRVIDRGDLDRAEPSVVISDALAKRFFPNEDPIGRRVASNRPPPAPGAPPNLIWLTIVGVVADTPTGVVLPSGNPLPQVYMPLSIAGGPGIPRSTLIGPDISVMNYVVRASTPPLEMLPTVRRAVNSLDANLALAQVRTLQDIVDRASARMSFTMVLLAIAAAVALMLGVIGIYGVMSYIVTQRTSEIGVRLALGAEPGHVAGQIVRQGGGVALAGIGVGLGIALLGGRLIESLLFGISPRDPGVFAATTVGLLLVALAACWLPARRAARLSPLEALRSE
jgi:putative ABC transport system permease protein